MNNIKNQYCVDHDIKLYRIPYVYNTYSSFSILISKLLNDSNPLMIKI